MTLVNISVLLVTALRAFSYFTGSNDFFEILLHWQLCFRGIFNESTAILQLVIWFHMLNGPSCFKTRIVSL